MLSELVLIHRPGGQGRSTLANDLGPRLGSGHEAFFWQTCLRQIALIDEAELEILRPALLRGDEIYHADVAYRFLLEVTCGLHSPILGETEVYGQVKAAVQNHRFHATPIGSRLKRFFQFLFEDAKKIRQAHLEELGGQSYGSVLRRELRDVEKIGVLGAGQMVSELLPWLDAKGRSITIYCRDPVKAALALQVPTVERRDRSTLKIEPLSELSKIRPENEVQAWIIAAPVSAIELMQMFPQKTSREISVSEWLIDLRADSATDPLAILSRQRIKLGDLFDRLIEQESELKERKSSAMEAIAEAVLNRSSSVENRPFGWEDVCA